MDGGRAGWELELFPILIMGTGDVILITGDVILGDVILIQSSPLHSVSSRVELLVEERS